MEFKRILDTGFSGLTTQLFLQQNWKLLGLAPYRARPGETERDRASSTGAKGRTPPYMYGEPLPGKVWFEAH